MKRLRIFLALVTWWLLITVLIPLALITPDRVTRAIRDGVLHTVARRGF